jgi:hypothetical protein
MNRKWADYFKTAWSSMASAVMLRTQTGMMLYLTGWRTSKLNARLHGGAFSILAR